jgi:hypothetical protein
MTETAHDRYLDYDDFMTRRERMESEEMDYEAAGYVDSMYDQVKQ